MCLLLRVASVILLGCKKKNIYIREVFCVQDFSFIALTMFPSMLDLK